MRITPASELQARCNKLQERMTAADLEAVLVIQNADLFYFTGSIQQGLLYVPAAGEPVYMVRKDYLRARMECGLKEIVPFKSPRDIPGILAGYGLPLPQRAGMELDVLPVATFNRFRTPFGACEMVDAAPLIRAVRAVKSKYEIEIMKDAALQVEKVCKRAKEVIRPGMTDFELAAELEYCARQAGHQGLTRMRGFNSELFYGHVFSGADSAAPAFNDTPAGGHRRQPLHRPGGELQADQGERADHRRFYRRLRRLPGRPDAGLLHRRAPRAPPESLRRHAQDRAAPQADRPPGRRLGGNLRPVL